MATAFQIGAFQPNAFQIDVAVLGAGAEAFAPYRKKALREDKDILEMIKLFVITEDM